MKHIIKNQNQIKSIVVGGGFGGIAIALRLRALGHQVTLLEKLNSLGGRAQVFKKNGFKHDAGPTVITAPFLFDELFELFGEKREDYVEFKPLDPWYRFHFHDGQTFDYSQTIEKTKMEMRKFSNEDANSYEKLLKASKSFTLFLYSQLNNCLALKLLTSLSSQISTKSSRLFPISDVLSVFIILPVNKKISVFSFPKLTYQSNFLTANIYHQK